MPADPDPLPSRLDGIADRIAAVPVQAEDAAAIRDAAFRLRAIERVATRTVLVCPSCGCIKGEDPNCGWMGDYKRIRVPVSPVPVPDEQAIERAARALVRVPRRAASDEEDLAQRREAIERAATALYDLPPYTTLDEKVRAVLTAALEQPE